jgi:ligand-binding sensor domain-containing protein/serine phosphatase RsbU (regulator of sigma subunit)
LKRLLVFSLLVLIFLHLRLSAQQPFAAFSHVTLDDGLSSNIIRSLYKDQSGFMWIGTNNGINRYNGYSVKSYLPNPADSNAILGKVVIDIDDDLHGNLWIITEECLNRYDQKKDKFYHYFTAVDTSLGKGFHKILVDKVTGHIWLSSYKYVTIRFDPKKNKVYKYKHDPNDLTSVGPGGVMQFAQEKDGTFWHTSWNYGLSKYNREKDNFTHYLHDPNDSTTIIKEPIYGLSIDTKGGIWVSTFINNTHPIARLDTKTGKFRRFKAGVNGAPLSSYRSTADLNGNMWFASMLSGLYFYDHTKDTFTKFFHKSADSETISENVVANLYTDNDNNLWAGTLNKGANVTNLNFKNVTYYSLPQKAGEEEPYIATLSEDDIKNIWIGSSIGLFKIGKKTNSMQKFVLNKNSPKEYIGKILNSHDGNMIVTANHEVYQVDILTMNAKLCTDTALTKESLHRIHKDKLNNIWLIYWDHILLYKDGNFDLTPMKISLPISNLPNLFLYHTVFEDGNYLWVAFDRTFIKINIHTGATIDLLSKYLKPELIVSTPGYHKQKGGAFIRSPYGKLIFNTDSNKFYLFNAPFLCQDEVIPKISFYTYEDIVFSTYRGVFLYNLRTGKYSHPAITHNDRITPDQVSILDNGKLFIPSNNGFLSFRPEMVEEMAVKRPHIVIDEFYLFNKPMEVDKPGSPLKNHINYTSELVLNYTQSVFSFDLTLLNFDEVQKNEYAYILEGFEKDWNYVGSRRLITYTNIPAGEYLFKYKGRDKNGNWSFTRSLKIIILPPFWETGWFRLLIFLVTSGTIYAIVKLRINIIKKQKEELEEQVILRTAEIFQQKEEILTQQEKIYEIYNELTDSIQTSKRIQDSILPEERAIKKHFNDAMVFFRPKDIVSGDFYWMHAVDNRVYIAAADCTGHGVSGAFMSFIGYNILNKIIETNPKAEPVQILNQLNTLLIQALHQESENPITKDGMDISLCCFCKDTMELQFAGANNPLYIIRKGHLEAIKADKNSIGIQPLGKMSQFTNHSIILSPDDVFYIFSDGLMSQFGSETGQEKFKHTRFRNLLVSICSLSMQDQRGAIETAFMDWKKGVPQTDDIMVLGMRV